MQTAASVAMVIDDVIALVTRVAIGVTPPPLVTIATPRYPLVTIATDLRF